MINDSFSKIFWGFLLVLLEIHFIFIDILPDPLGYFLIYLGVKTLGEKYTNQKLAEYMSLGLLFLSIPTVFIQNTKIDELGYQLFNGWEIYMTGINLLKLILVYYVFKLMLAVCKEHGERLLELRTASIFKIYIGITLFNYLLQSFFMNMTQQQLLGVTIFIIISTLILEITFLVLLHAFRKLKIIDASESVKP